MRALVALVLALLALSPLPVAAGAVVSTRTWSDAAGNRWTETTTVETGSAAADGADRLVAGPPATPIAAIARYGPFVVIDATHAALVDATDTASPRRLAALLRAWPGIRVLEMVDCPGTVDDTANLAVGRMIRAHGLATDVPAGGSVRSGAVDLFVAGVHRHAAPDADFGVHAWEDEQGRGPADFAANAAVNRAYLAYYRAMGLSAKAAAGFYALTNSVPNREVLWLRRGDIARFVPLG